MSRGVRFVVSLVYVTAAAATAVAVTVAAGSRWPIATLATTSIAWFLVAAWLVWTLTDTDEDGDR